MARPALAVEDLLAFFGITAASAGRMIANPRTGSPIPGTHGAGAGL
jgi:hypothetical protein